MSDFKRHALSAAFPSMGVDDFEALTSDIAANGLRSPIVLFEGEVLDGWHRYTACLAAGVEPTFAEFEGNDPVAFVISANLHRRQLTGSQRAASIVACSAWKPAHRPPAGNSAPGSELLAKQAEVSTRTIEHAKAAQLAGLGDEVRDGKVSAKRAAEIAKLPKEDWVEALQRKSEPKPVEILDEPPEGDVADTLDDLQAEVEALERIVNADDRIVAAWDEAKLNAQKLAQMTQLYDGKCAELAEMTRTADRWMRKFNALEKKAVQS